LFAPSNGAPIAALLRAAHMTIYKFTNLTLPPTLEKRRETLEAFRTLVDQDDELIRQRRAEIVAIRRGMEDMRRSFDAIRRQMLELRKYGYNPEEPRVPKRHTGGGEWTQTAASDNPGQASDAPIPYQKSGVGHHWVPRTIYEKRNFSDEVKSIFDGWTSGTLADPKVNSNTKEHIKYNERSRTSLRSL
jgi:hypothetical protein